MVGPVTGGLAEHCIVGPVTRWDRPLYLAGPDSRAQIIYYFGEPVICGSSTAGISNRLWIGLFMLDFCGHNHHVHVNYQGRHIWPDPVYNQDITAMYSEPLASLLPLHHQQRNGQDFISSCQRLTISNRRSPNGIKIQLHAWAPVAAMSTNWAPDTEFSLAWA